MKVSVDQGVTPKKLNEVPVGTLVAIGSPDGKVAIATGPGSTIWASQLLVLQEGVYYALQENAMRETVYPLSPNATVTLSNGS